MNNKSIAYNRKQSQWEYTINDELVDTAPKGQAGKQHLWDSRIKSEHPLAYNMLVNLRANTGDEQIKQRAFKGAAILCDGLVLEKAQTDADTVLARVATPNATLEYLVFQGGDKRLYSCSCPDHQKGRDMAEMGIDNPNRPSYGAPSLGNGIGPMCKHTYAYHYAKETQVMLPLINPYSDLHANSLHYWLRDATNTFIGETTEALLVSSKPISFNRGVFTISVDNRTFLKLTGWDKAKLGRIVLERTNHTFRIEYK